MARPRRWMVVPRLQTSRRAGLLTLFCASLAVSCLPPPVPASSAVPDAPKRPHRQAKQPPSQPLSLDEEIERARLAAQKALLGESGIFVDGGVDDAAEIALPMQHQTLGTSLVATRESQEVFDLLLSLPGSSGKGGEAPTLAGIDGDRLGLFEPLEQAPIGRHPLAHFYDALSSLRDGKDDDGKVRVLAYGASHTDADIYPHYLRVYLQTRFGDGGHGFVHAAKPWKWYRHIDVEVEGFDHWKTEHAQRRLDREDGFYGLLGASLATTHKGAFGRIRHRNDSVGSHYELAFLAQPGGGRLRLLVDGREAAVISTASPMPAVGYHTLSLPEGQHELEIQPIGDGEVRVFGWTVERDAPGVVVDTLGIGGTRAANMLKWDEVTWADQVRRRKPDLIMLAYGTNEATDEKQPLDEYAANLRLVIQRLQRAAPEASCLLVGPGDFPRKAQRELYVPRPRVARIADVQAEVAAEMGCGFWDTLAFMGGTMSMVQWVRAVPQMAKGDHIHLTRRGYVRMGMALTDAIMMDFDRALGTSDTALAERARR